MPRRPGRSPRTELQLADVRVSDLGSAVGYYVHVLGFACEQPPEPDSAVLRGHGLRIRLRRTARAELDQMRAGEVSRTVATAPVADPRRLRRRLDRMDADVEVPPSLRAARDGHFAVADPDGNTLAFRPAAGFRAQIRNRAGAGFDALSTRLHEWRRRREEARHVEEFRAFYERLPDKNAIFYLFFSEGLLHWVLKAMSYVPSGVNLVLIGSALPEEERAWITESLDRPFHHVDLRIDDRIAWQFLAQVNRHDFGWLDSDCLVLNPELFGELARIGPTTSMNCVWSWESGYGWHLANTFLLFVSVDALDAVRRRGVLPDPCSHDYDWHRLLVPGRRCYSSTPSRAQRQLLAEILPVDSEGRPRTPHGMSYFDTMVMVQLLARACGRPVHRVRELEGFGHLRGRPIQDESSDELVHIGGGSRADALSAVTGFFHDSHTRLLYLIAEHVMLDATAVRLPPAYQRRHERLLSALVEAGYTTASAEELLSEHLMHDRGLSSAAAAAVLGRPSITRPSVAGPAPTPTPDGSASPSVRK